MSEETEAEYKDAGGGKGIRAYFSHVNSREETSRLERSLQLAHQEIEDADEQETLAQERNTKAYAMEEKPTRELENEKTRHSYMSLQYAQEAGR